MNIKAVNVKVGATINLGNYESLRLDYGMEAELEEGDTPSQAIDKIRDHLTKKMKADLINSNGGKNLLK